MCPLVLTSIYILCSVSLLRVNLYPVTLFKSGEFNTEALTWMIIEKKYYMSNPPSLLYHSTQATYVPMSGPPAKNVRVTRLCAASAATLSVLAFDNATCCNALRLRFRNE